MPGTDLQHPDPWLCTYTHRGTITSGTQDAGPYPHGTIPWYHIVAVWGEGGGSDSSSWKNLTPQGESDSSYSERDYYQSNHGWQQKAVGAGTGLPPSGWPQGQWSIQWPYWNPWGFPMAPGTQSYCSSGKFSAVLVAQEETQDSASDHGTKP